MEPSFDASIHPWWVRRARFFAGLAALIVVSIAAGAVVLITQFEFGHEAFASGEADTPRHVGLGDVEPDAPDVVPYWEANDHFHPLPEPKPGDWLYSFDEPGQSVDEYFASGPNAITSLHHTIYLQPLGEFGDESPDLGIIAEYVEIYFGLPTRILPGIDPEGYVTSRTGWTGPHEQWLTTDLMRILWARRPEDAYAVLGVTMTDLYPGDEWAFVFGQARFKARVGVHSFARYRPSWENDLSPDEREKRYLRRALKVTTHELGHVFGILHCVHHRCNMNGVNSLEESDDAPLYLCPVDLRKIQTAVGFHPADRYAQLAAFYDAHGLYEEAEWARTRIVAPTSR